MELVIPEMTGLTFEESEHEYRLNDIVIPSVTQIMKPLSDDKYGTIRADVLDKAARKGTAVHNAIELWILYGIEDINPEYQPYFNAFKDWWGFRNPKPVTAELKFYHKVFRYAGTADFICEIDGEVTLVDWKTTYTVSDKLCGVQLEAYRQACLSHGIEIKKKKIVQLKKYGKYKEYEYPDVDNERWGVFTSLMTVRNYIGK